MSPEEIAKLLYLDKCTFNDECDFCECPEQGTFARNKSGPEYDDDFYWICGKCLENIEAKHPNLRPEQLLQKIDNEQANTNKLPF